MTNEAKRNYLGDPRVWLVSAAFTGAILSSVRLYKRYLRPIRAVTEIPQRAFHKRKLLGRVTRVGDGDNFHFFHTPGGVLAGWYWLRYTPAPNLRTLKGKTLHVRLCGVDAPERAHFGKPAQPFGDEAMAWLKDHLLGKRVKVKPLSVDHYGRVVSKVFRFHWLGGWKDVSLEMIKNGWGVAYEGKTGAQFDGQREKYIKMEKRAKLAKRGIWSRGKRVVTPGEFKKQN